MDKKLTVYLFSSSHWDREWYQNFQGFRWRLTDMVDDLIEKLEDNPEFKQFTFDGQTIVLEDYLEIAPENKERLAKLRPLTEGEVERLREEFMVEFTYNSNAIEGNTLTLKETALALEGMTIDQKPLKDHLEAVGHRDAFLYAQDIAQNNVPISESVIKNIHALVLMNRPDDKGVYRRIPVRIMGAYTEPVQPYMIAPKMEELIAKNEGREHSMHIIERIARFHLEFEGIHPFIDGNGRTGRLIMNLDLIRNGFPPINVKFADRKRYYDAFDAYYKEENTTHMIELIAEYISERFDDYFSVLE